MAKTITLVAVGTNQHYSEPNLTANFTALNNNFANFLHVNGVGESGNTMLGNLDMGGLRIMNLTAPSLASDAATKAYVDAASLGAVTSTVVGVADEDGDTGLQAEASADLDRLDLFAGTSAGAENALQVVGDDSAAAALTNPYLIALKHIVLDTGVRIGDAASADTYIELNRSGSANHIYLVAGSNTVLELDSASVLVHQDILLYDNTAAAAGKKIGDQDGDTYIQFNQATGGTDDDTIRFYAAGSQVLAVGASGLSDLVALRVENLAIGIALPGASENHNLILTTGTANAASDMDDNTVVLHSGVVSGIQNKLNIDFKTGASSKVTVVLGNDSTFPNDVVIGNDLTVNGTANLDKIGTVGAAGWPSCWAYFALSQTAKNYTTPTEVVFDSEVYDTNANFNVSTGRFTPTQAGKYLLIGRARVDLWTPATNSSSIAIRKNSSVSAGDVVAGVFSVGSADPDFGDCQVSAIFDMNGTTDYVSMYIQVYTDTSITLVGTPSATYFMASRIA
jgi:hypothetical protein